MKTAGIVVSAHSFVEILFQFTDGRQFENRRFVQMMIERILLSKSTLLSNIARSLNENIRLIYVEQRLSKSLRGHKIPWEELRARSVEVSSSRVKDPDVIAFDPGDLVKSYALKMENLYPVYDGSEKCTALGYEDFSVEAVQWANGKRHHIPLYHKLINASCADYISQNHQIIEAIRAIFETTRGKGIWTFDRAHDRSTIYCKALLVFESMRWIVRVKENRSVIPENPGHVFRNKYYTGLMDVVKQIPLSEHSFQLRFPQVSGNLHVGWTRIKLAEDHRTDRWLSLVVVHDRRNQDPVVLLSSEKVSTVENAVVVFGHYIERWRKEEGYRFCKSFLNIENIRVMSFESVSNLAWLAHLTYIFVTLFYRSDPDCIDVLMEMELKHFVPLEKVSYRYYRVAELMRLLLWRQLGKPSAPLQMTEVA